MLGQRWLVSMTVLMVINVGIWGGAVALAADDRRLPDARTAIVDYQRILQESAAAMSIAAQIEMRRGTYRDEIGKAEHQQYEDTRSLAGRRSTLSEDEQKVAQEAVEATRILLQELAQQRSEQLKSDSADAADEFTNVLIAIATDIAEERGINLVLPASRVLFFSRQIDLTDEVLAKLDAKLPTVKLHEAVD